MSPAMSDAQATVLDNYGDQIRIEADGSNVLITFYGADDGQPCVITMILDAERRDQFIRAYAAAEMTAEAARDEEAGSEA